METVMLSHISFPFSPEQFNQVRRPGTIFTTVQSSKNEFSWFQKVKEEATVLNKILHIFVYSYPDNPLSKCTGFLFVCLFVCLFVNFLRSFSFVLLFVFVFCLFVCLFVLFVRSLSFVWSFVFYLFVSLFVSSAFLLLIITSLVRIISQMCCPYWGTHGLQPIPRNSNDKDMAAMLDELTIEANEESFVIVLHHGGNDITWKWSICNMYKPLRAGRG